MNEVRAGWSATDAVVGVDFGTPSGGAVVVTVDDGTELGSMIHEYPHAVERVPAPFPSTAVSRPGHGEHDAEAGRTRSSSHSWYVQRDRKWIVR
jgi:hypothetical protein